MINPKEIPSEKMVKIWKNLSKTQRLEYHLGIIASHFNALSYSYQVLDD